MIPAGCTGESAGRRSAAAEALAAFDFPDGTLVLTEAGDEEAGLAPPGAGEAALAELDRGGLEVLGVDLRRFRGR